MAAMTTDDDLCERLAAYEGRPAAIAGEGGDPVDTPMIRHWREALGHPVPPDGTAPALMLQVWAMRGLAGHPGTAGVAPGPAPTTNSSRCSTGPAEPRSSPPTASRSACGRCAPASGSPSTR